MRVEKVILNISSEPFMLDRGITFRDLPERVRLLFVRGRIELYNVPNLGPYRKLLPTVERYLNETFVVATADDDVLYPPDWLQGLLVAYERHQCITAYRCRKLTFKSGRLQPYNNWPIIRQAQGKASENEISDAKSINFLPTGRCGILYHSTHLSGMTSLIERFRVVAPGQDDLAFKWAALIADIPTALAVSSATATFDSGDLFDGFHNVDSLYSQNRSTENNLSVNDIVWNNIARFCIENEIAPELASRLTIST
jgi:hypothetical protein